MTEAVEEDLLIGKKSNYKIMNLIGQGCFGSVARGVNLCNKQDVAIKILSDERAFKREIDMTEIVSVLDPVKYNLVRFYEKVEKVELTYLVFERLDRNLEELLVDRRCKPLSVSEIRPIAQQVLTALKALRGLGVIHSDLKPDNIMLVNHYKEPFRIKLIDFGLSFRTSEVTDRMVVQPVGYRAPEVSLGLPISHPIDLWGLGCVLAYLFLGEDLFNTECEYQMMRSIITLLGKPEDYLLNAATNTHWFFRENLSWKHPKWSLKNPMQFKFDTGIEPSEAWPVYFTSLDQLETINQEGQEPIHMINHKAFINLLKHLLHMDSELRITAAEALRHTFISMEHMEGLDTSLYECNASEKMTVCKLEDWKDDSILNDKVSASPLCADDITNEPATLGEIPWIKTNNSLEETSDDKTEEAVQGVSSTSPCTNECSLDECNASEKMTVCKLEDWKDDSILNDKVSASPLCADDITNEPATLREIPWIKTNNSLEETSYDETEEAVQGVSSTSPCTNECSLDECNASEKMTVCKLEDWKDDSILNDKVSASPLCIDDITNEPATLGEIPWIKTNNSLEETSDDKTEEAVQGVSSTSPCTNECSLDECNASEKMTVCKLEDWKDDSILNDKVSASPLCADDVTNEPATLGEILWIKMDNSLEETSDDKTEEAVQGVSSTSPCANECSTNLPEGAAAAGAEGAEAVDHDAISCDPIEEKTEPDGSPDVKRKKSLYKRIGSFFRRKFRTLFRRKRS